MQNVMETFPIEKSIISINGIKDYIFPKYKIDKNAICLFIQHGLNDTYKIITKTHTYYLRIYRRGWRTINDIKSEIQLVDFLKEQGISVSNSISSELGEKILSINAPEGIRYVVLFESAKGIYQGKNINENKSEKFGELVGKIHKASDKLPKIDRFSLDFDHLYYEPLSRIKSCLTNRKNDYEYLENIGELILKEIELLVGNSSGFKICHGDLHTANVFFDENDNPCLFDFDCFGYSWRSYDLGIFLWDCLLMNPDWTEENKKHILSLWESFLKGYKRENKLSSNEIKAAQMFVPIRYIFLMGLQIDRQNDWGWGNYINDAYFDNYLKKIKNYINLYNILE